MAEYDASEYDNLKILTFEGINNSPREPTIDRAGNGSHTIARVNELIDLVKRDISNALTRVGDLEARVGDLEARIGDLEARIEDLEATNTESPSYTITVDITTTETDLFTIDEQLILNRINFTNATDEYGFYFLLNGSSIGGGIPTSSNDGGFDVIFDPSITLNSGDIIGVVSYSDSQSDVTISLIFDTANN